MSLLAVAMAFGTLGAATAEDASLVQQSHFTLSHRPGSPSDAQNLGRAIHELRWSLEGPGWRSALGGLLEAGAQARRVQSTEGFADAQLREAWWSRTWEALQLRLGRDVLSEGFFDTPSGLNQLSPTDFARAPEDFLVAPKWRQRPIWFARLAWFGERLNLQLTYLPIFEPHRVRPISGDLALGDTSFGGTAGILSEGGASLQATRALEEALLVQGAPGVSPTSGTGELRVGTSTGAVAWTLVGAWLWDRVPRIRLPAGAGLGTALGLANEQFYGRHLRLGAEGEAPVGPLLLRGLLVHSPRRAFLRPDGDGGFDAETAAWSQAGLGIEYQGGLDFRLGCEVLLDIYHGDGGQGPRLSDEAFWPSGQREVLRIAPTASLRPVADGRWRLEFGGTLQTSSGDGLAIGEVVTEVGRQGEVRAGGSLFYGPEETPLGDFNNRDGLWLRYGQAW